MKSVQPGWEAILIAVTDDIYDPFICNTQSTNSLIFPKIFEHKKISFGALLYLMPSITAQHWNKISNIDPWINYTLIWNLTKRYSYILMDQKSQIFHWFISLIYFTYPNVPEDEEGPNYHAAEKRSRRYGAPKSDVSDSSPHTTTHLCLHSPRLGLQDIAGFYIEDGTILRVQGTKTPFI